MAQMQVEQPQIPVTGGNGVAGGSQQATTSLYVADLDKSVTDSQLYDLFNQVGQVMSVKVVKDNANESLGHGYVNYSNPDDAARALDVLNFTPVNSKTIRIMYSERDPTSRKNVAANVFIKNLDKSIDGRALHEIFSRFGTIKSCKIEIDSSGESKGFGFVQFDSEEAAQKAIDKLDVTTEEDLSKIFGEYGRITSVVVMRDVNGKSKCFGFVNFDNADDAAKAVEVLNGKKFDDKEWYVGKAQKKSERMMELKSQFEHTAKEQVDKSKGLNLYVKNLDDTIDDDKLKGLFSDFGTITSCKVMRDPSGISRGSGFVAFSTPDEAARALAEMNGKMTVSKPLYVALAERKEERRARLQAQFSQVRPVAVPPSVAPQMPIYPPGAASFGQQIFYGQGPVAINPSQAGFGYQQQLAPALRPGGGPIPNLYMPMVPPGQRPGGRRGAGPAQQTQQAIPVLQHQMMPRGRMYRFPPGRNMAEMPGGGGVLPVPYGIGGMLPRDAAPSQPMPITALASALANAPADQQRTMLGENLYPLVDQLEHDHAAKVTGMLLEMDQTEVLHLLESPDALKAKVAEALEVLKNVSQVNPADQLANLSLNDNLVS
ncbi:putative polyadenylate-binding protein 8-like [Heracleum sosnowskyi]|uniref:Polyadenylate-binding protein 8-like n=1 Tax=Heracleum sosnowskyi TaxID=360622 RepID=A0AAD8JJR8_9APIA|nr:putative polyadenylate-binding protein 8-like [Heracleum sosnowskyi]